MLNCFKGSGFHSKNQRHPDPKSNSLFDQETRPPLEGHNISKFRPIWMTFHSQDCLFPGPRFVLFDGHTNLKAQPSSMVSS